ncbi:helix-turn-helix domain-containing protein [Helcococcus kunzii]|uniref:HTH cro/C1-type domain-containing protein n=1 Tax=Helcococcus kunzii ATCC 51366 TaxID=883114 RepID=H3NLC8_9FIRM|nr:helix-turn-helix transcriptional regulator [Helcococcus kunzii]EHR36009.1 hypothetical protein HMPREF9709_00105 [Helcococcus kunzii ATCC 51366]MCT1796593.1 helix-turn-helix domain-containing protein [Helcococcus kunzii]MCT1988763.1 helix-turn-helix domain-containing protein [Helcococcus kunzii]QUY64037.1 helix-turn-helix domain-containing protein [Helcococcus kunzii]QZO76507.1 helix-turn-helix domain-containing protein [Helcococcus kunzii]
MSNGILKNPFDLFKDIDKKLKEKIEIDRILVDIASAIILYRVENNLSQKELAKKLDMTQAMISKLESGDYNPTVKMLVEISNKLDLIFNLEFGSKNTEQKVVYESPTIINIDREYGVLAS